MDNIFHHNDEYILKANEYMEEWNYLEAKRLLIKFLEEEPNHGPAHFLLGKIYGSQLDDDGTAIYHFKLALEHCPILIPAYYWLVNMYLLREECSKALQICQQALTQTGIAGDYIYLKMAQAYEISGQLVEASQHYQKGYLRSIDQEVMSKCETGLSRIKRKQRMLNRIQVDYWISPGQLA